MSTGQPGSAILWLVLSGIAATLSGCGGGGGSGGGSSQPPPPPADTTAPTVSLATAAATVSRTVPLAASATDDRGVSRVEFLVDGTVIGTDTSSPYSFDWNTAQTSEGAHSITARATDAAGNSAVTTAVTFTVRNSLNFDVVLSGRESMPATGSLASGSLTLTVNIATGAVSGSLKLTGMSATAVHLHDGFAGQNGPVLVGLAQNASASDTWDFPANAALTLVQVDHLLAGDTYMNAHSGAFPNGEIRGQILPAGFSIAVAKLEGLQEVPEVTASASGYGAVTINRNAARATIHLTVSGATAPTASHLHTGFGGLNGPVVIPLTQDGSDPTHWFANDQPVSAADIAALAAGGTYLNLHTQANPNGEIRGQVVPADILFIANRLSGSQEVPANTSTARGTVAVTVERTTRRLRLDLNASGVDDSVGAHVHQAYAGTNGSINVPLIKDGADPKHWSATDVQLTEAQFAALMDGRMYANVHTPARPGGEIRAQLLPEHVQLTYTAMSGAEEVPAAPIAAGGLAATTVNLASKRISVHVRATGVDDSTAAHIHRGARGSNGPVQVPLAQEAGSPGHWFAEDQAVTDAQLNDYRGALWYVNVHTPAYPGGAIRGQIGLEALPPPDVTKPTVALAAPPATVSGTVPLTATAQDNIGVASVRFLANGTVIGTDDTAPYSVDWVTTAVPNGAVSLVAEARDAAGNTAQSPPIVVTVNNVIPPVGDTTPPTVTLLALPVTVSGTTSLTATAQDNVGVTEVRFLANGAVIGTTATSPYAVFWDTTTLANGSVTIRAEARDAAGNVGQSAPQTVNVNNVASPTLTELQATIFGPLCSGCHTGGGGGLPSSMNLSSRASSFAALVNVASVQQPAVLRVKPGDAANSYLVRKLEGAASITGARMPFGGPYLSAADLNKVAEWINTGAPNN